MAFGLDVLRQRSVTAPVSAGSVSTRIASSAAAISCRDARLARRSEKRGEQALTDDVGIVVHLELLEHRVWVRVATCRRAQQHRQPIDRGEGRAITMLVAPGPT